MPPGLESRAWGGFPETYSAYYTEYAANGFSNEPSVRFHRHGQLRCFPAFPLPVFKILPIARSTVGEPLISYLH